VLNLCHARAATVVVAKTLTRVTRQIHAVRIVLGVIPRCPFLRSSLTHLLGGRSDANRS